MVQYSTPNASLYAFIASKACRIPVRLYCQWGMVYVSRTGIKRKIFKSMEKLICKKSTNVQPDSLGGIWIFAEEKDFTTSRKVVLFGTEAPKVWI